LRRAPAIVAASVVALVCACTPSAPAAPAPTTSTTIAAPLASGSGESTTTTEPTTLGGSEGFQTRQGGSLIIGTERLFAPWYTGPGTGEVTGGFDYELSREIGSRLGVPIVKVVKTSLVLMMTGQDCKCDVMLGGLTITDGRARSLDLSEPYLAADQAALVRKGTIVSNTAEASVLRWGVAVSNTTGQDVLRTRVKPLATPLLVTNEADGIRRVADGRLDAMLMNTPEALAVAHDNPALAVPAQFITGEQYAVALSLGSPNTSLINEVIRSMRDDGIIDALLTTYLGANPKDVPVIGP
jgi:ABC-type amino acid transport substrate-binding protein